MIRFTEQSLSSRRFDVLVQTEEIIRVVFFLALNQPIVIASIGEPDSVLFLLREEIHVRTSGSKWRCRLEKFSRSTDTLGIVRRAVPPPVHIQHELGIAMCIRRGILRHAGDGFA